MNDRRRLLAILDVLGESNGEHVERSAQSLADDPWPRLDAILVRHHATPAFLSRLHDRGWLDRFAPEAVAACRKRSQAVLARNLGLLALRDGATVALAKAGIDVLVFKGAALLDRVFPSPGYRPASDVDLLVRPADARAAVQVLASLDLAPARPDAAELMASGRLSEVTLLNETGRHAVDLHVAVKESSAAATLSLTAALWRDARSVGPHVFEPAPEAHLLYLVAHGVLQHTVHQARQFLDWHHPLQHWQARPEWSWPRALELARELDLAEALDCVLVATDRVLGTRYADARGLTVDDQVTIRQLTADSLVEVFLSDLTDDLKVLGKMSEYWEHRDETASWRRFARRGAMLGSGATGLDGAPSVYSRRLRLAVRIRAAICLLRSPRTAWRLFRLHERLRRP